MSSEMREVCMWRVCFLLLKIKKEHIKLKDKEDTATVAKYRIKKCKKEIVLDK